MPCLHQPIYELPQALHAEQGQRPAGRFRQGIEQHGDDTARRPGQPGPVFDDVMQRRHAMDQNAAAHQEHGGGAEHGEQTHQLRRRQQQALAHPLGQPEPFLQQPGPHHPS
jgi:hypothetical protein